MFFHFLFQQFVGISCTMDCLQEFLYTGFPSRISISEYGFNVLVDKDTCVPIDNRSPFSLNSASICGTVLAVSELDVIRVNVNLRECVIKCHKRLFFIHDHFLRVLFLLVTFEILCICISSVLFILYYVCSTAVMKTVRGKN